MVSSSGVSMFEAVRVEDVEVVDAHAAKALVKARQHVLA